MKSKTEENMKLESLYKVASECELNSPPDSLGGQSVWTEFRGCGFQSHSGELSIATSKNRSVVNIISMSSFRYSHVIASTKLYLNKRVDWWRQYSKLNLKLSKIWKWSGCTKLALSASWTHVLIALSDRVSEWNSVVVGWNPTQAKLLIYVDR